MVLTRGGVGLNVARPHPLVCGLVSLAMPRGGVRAERRSVLMAKGYSLDSLAGRLPVGGSERRMTLPTRTRPTFTARAPGRGDVHP